jgi:hypothetical protein
MAAFSEFLAELFGEGKVVFRSGEKPRDRPTDGDVAILREAFATFALSVAGPPIAFDVRTATEAADLVRQASWALVDREERPADLKRRLRMTAVPTTPAQHLSADLLLRYLPQLVKRASGLDPTDPLAEFLADVLRRWPLTGALSDIEDAPLAPAEFGGHPGLLLLYAERLTAHDRPTWRPGPTSPAYDYYQLVSSSSARSPKL